MAQVKFEVVVKRENDHFICEVVDSQSWNKLTVKFVPGIYWDVMELKFTNPRAPFRKLYELGMDTRFQVKVKELAKEMMEKNITKSIIWVFF